MLTPTARCASRGSLMQVNSTASTLWDAVARPALQSRDNASSKTRSEPGACWRYGRAWREGRCTRQACDSGGPASSLGVLASLGNGPSLDNE